MPAGRRGERSFVAAGERGRPFELSRAGGSLSRFASRGVEAPECVLDVAHEVARYGDGQLHAVGAILGGIASQEIIKIITQQYTPMTKRLIYDGVHSTTAYVG